MFFNNFQNLCKERGVSPSSVTKAVGINPSSCSGWKNGAVPRYSTLKKIADYFNVEVDELTGLGEPLRLTYEHKPSESYVKEETVEYSAKEKLTTSNGSELTPDEIELIKLYRASSPETKKRAYEEALRILKESLD